MIPPSGRDCRPCFPRCECRHYGLGRLGGRDCLLRIQSSFGWRSGHIDGPGRIGSSGSAAAYRMGQSAPTRLQVFTGHFRLIWSDHEAWPIGSLSVVQTYFGSDPRILQHKTFGVLLLAVGIVELLRRFGRLGHIMWTVPLPILATIAGVTVFGHSHGTHPSAQKIAIHHTRTGTMALAARSSKLLSGSWYSASGAPRVIWEWIWGAGLRARDPTPLVLGIECCSVSPVLR